MTLIKQFLDNRNQDERMLCIFSETVDKTPNVFTMEDGGWSSKKNQNKKKTKPKFN